MITVIFAAQEVQFYDVWALCFHSISGIVNILRDGSIHSYNQNFVENLFGYTSNDLLNQVCEKVLNQNLF